MEKLEDLDLSLISSSHAGNTLHTDQAMDFQSIEWKYADGFRLKDDDYSDGPSQKNDASQQFISSANSSFMNSQKSGCEQLIADDFMIYTAQNKENILDEGHTESHTNAGRSGKKINLMSGKKPNSSNIRREAAVSVLKPNTQLQNIPETEVEETPLNRKSTVPSYLKQTLSFAQRSLEANSSSGKNKSRLIVSAEKESTSLNSTVRRLFHGGSKQSSHQLPPVDSRYSQVTPRVDSNRDRKSYHEEILRKNKSKCLHCSSVQKTNEGVLALLGFEEENTALEEFNEVLNSQYSSWKVKAQYYAYLLRENERYNEIFVRKINQQFQKDQHELKLIENSEGSHLLQTIEDQREQIINLSSKVNSLEEKCEKLSSLLAMYKDQMALMNDSERSMANVVKQIQDELGSIDLFFTFNDHQQFDNSSAGQITGQISRVMNYVRSLELQIKSSKDSNAQIIEDLTKKLSDHIIMPLFINISDHSDQQEKNSFFHLNAIIEQAITAIQLFQEAKAKEYFSLQQNYKNNELFFKDSLTTLTNQLDRLVKQQIRVQQEVMQAKFEKVRDIHSQLKEALAFPHQLNLKNITNINTQSIVISDLLLLLDWLEICVNVDCLGALLIDETLLTSICSSNLRDWGKKFAYNLRLSFAQHVKHSFETRINLPIQLEKKLRKYIYSNNTGEYFDQIIKFLKV